MLCLSVFLYSYIIQFPKIGISSESQSKDLQCHIDFTLSTVTLIVNEKQKDFPSALQ